jgi:hypothetical protein
MLRDLLARLLPRWLAILLGVRRVTPYDGYWPHRSFMVAELDTGGTFRAAWRPQDPSKDPKEPNGGESSSAGSDHGWSNCTMASAALALAYQQPRGELAPWGGDLRHRQADQSGGTDLYDAADAWRSYGETLTIKSGSGWSALVDAHQAGRAIVIQGEGNVPGAETFDGGHACAIAPETHSSGDWLFGDPLASGWQWVAPSAIRSWAERWQSSIAYAVGEKPPAAPAPEPPPAPAPCPECPDPEPRIAYEVAYAVAADDDADVAEWIGWLRAGEPFAGDVWDAGRWNPAEPTDLRALFDAGCGGQLGSCWTRGPIPDPVASAYAALTTPASWNGSAWRAALWDG